MRNFEIVKNKNKFFVLSAFIIFLGIVFYFINGLQLDVEYRGGTRILIETNSEIDTNQADAVVEEALGKSVTTQSLKTYNPEDEDKMIYMLRFDIASDETLTDEERTLVYDIVAQNFDVKENGNHDMLSVSPTIGITSKSFADTVPKNAPQRHPSGMNLYENVDVFINTHLPMGDSVVEIPGLPQKMGPTSTFVNSFTINLLMIRTAEKLIERGIVPPVWTSSNAPGGDQANYEIEQRYIPRIKHLR
jgi:hypothetical protein